MRNLPMVPAACLVSIALAGCEHPEPRIELASITLDEIVAVGEVEASGEEEFGSIIDVQAATDSSFFVLDESAGSVSWFDLAGGYRAGARSRGAGPGELSRPVAMAVSGTDRLAIVDPPNGRLTIYRFASTAEQSQIAYDTQIAGAWSGLGAGRNLCSIGDRWFIRNPRAGSLIHEIDALGEVVRSFEAADSASVEEFGPFASIVEPQKNAGQILCLPDHNLVVSLGAHTGRARAYTPDGSPGWDVLLAGIRPIRFVYNGRSLTSEMDPDGGSHVGRSIVRWSPETVLLQYAWQPQRGRPEDRDFHGLVSIELDAATGAEVGRTTHLPFILDTRGSLAYSFENLPYPRVRVLRRGG